MEFSYIKLISIYLPGYFIQHFVRPRENKHTYNILALIASDSKVKITLTTFPSMVVTTSARGHAPSHHPFHHQLFILAHRERTFSITLDQSVLHLLHIFVISLFPYLIILFYL